MGGTAVEAVPGGLIDRVGVEEGPARRRFDWQVANVVLPDGTARPIRDVLLQVGPSRFGRTRRCRPRHTCPDGCCPSSGTGGR